MHPDGAKLVNASGMMIEPEAFGCLDFRSIAIPNFSLLKSQNCPWRTQGVTMFRRVQRRTLTPVFKSFSSWPQAGPKSKNQKKKKMKRKKEESHALLSLLDENILELFSDLGTQNTDKVSTA
jgi:hypothetical protein